MKQHFEKQSGIVLNDLFDCGQAGSLQSIRSFGQYSARIVQDYLRQHPEAQGTFAEFLQATHASKSTQARFSAKLLAQPLAEAATQLSAFDRASIQLIQAFYLTKAAEISPILQAHGFQLVRITSRGTEIYPTMCDLEKRDVDRYRVEIDPTGPLATDYDHSKVQIAIMRAKADIAALGWVLSETMLNRNFYDGEGDKFGKEITGVSRPYAMNLGNNYTH